MLGWLAALTCNDASLRRPRTANPGEKTSQNVAQVVSAVDFGPLRTIAPVYGITVSTRHGVEPK